MKNLIVITIFVLLILPATSFGEADTKGWQQIFDKHGISGYERELPGTEIKEFKAVAFVEARVEVIIEVLKDIPSYPSWLSRCKEAKILKKIDSDTILFFSEINTQWSIKNRGALIKSKSFIEPKTGTITVNFKTEKDENEYMLNKKFVPIVSLQGKFEIEVFGLEMVKITYTSMADPGGRIPAAMANKESRLHPVMSLKSLGKMVKLEKYIKAGMNSKEHEIVEGILSSAPLLKKILRWRFNEFVQDPEIPDMIFEDTALIEKIIADKASFKSIKTLIVRTYMKILNDERIITANKNKSLRSIFFIDRFFADAEFMKLLSKDVRFIQLILNDKPVLAKILNDRILLGQLLDNNMLARSITNDQKLVIQILHDENFASLITKKLPDFKTRKDFKAVVQKYVDSYREAG